MPDDIRQILELNASQALGELAKLDKGFSAFGNQLTATATRLAYFNDNAGKTIAALKQIAREADATFTSFAKLGNLGTIPTPSTGNAGGLLTGKAAADHFSAWLDNLGRTSASASTTAVQGINNVASAANTSLPQAAKRVETITLSWQTFARVIQTQMLVRGLNMVRDALTDSAQAALEFSKQVGEIRAINPERNFGEIAADIRQLSDSFNQPISRVAEAQYQTISDQFVTAADRAKILTAANLLAKTSNQDLADSAMLLTGALNAYGESSDAAGLRAAQFFKTVELGRLRMGELGTALGRVQSIGHELGVSMEELDASLISITIGGVKANEEPATQLRGIMTALLKPSDGMKAAFREIGVESGEAAIATWGLQGTLKQLQGTTNGSATGMATLFQNVRGLAGALRLATTGAEKYDEGMKALREADQAMLRKKFEEFTSTDAEKLTKELNKLANFFTAEFGAKLVGQLNGVIEALGGANGLLGILRVLTSEIPRDTALLAGFAGAAALLGSNLKLATFQVTSLRGALSLLAGIEVAKIAGTTIGEAISRRISAPQEQIREQVQWELDIRKQQTEAALRENERKNKELVQGLRQYVTEANKLYLHDAENLKSTLKIEEQVDKLAFDRIMQSRQRMTHELFSVAETAANKAAEDIPRAIQDIEQKVSDRRFVEQEITGRSLESQFNAYAIRFEQTARLASELQGTAKSAEQEKEADKAWSRAEALRQQAEEIAKQTGDANKLREVEWMIESLDRTRIDALQEQARTQDSSSKEAEARAIQAEQHNLELEEMRRSIEQKLKLTAKDMEGGARFKGKDELQRDLADAERMIGAFAGKLTQYNSEDFIKGFWGDTRAFESLRREAERALASADLKKIEAAPQVFADLYGGLQERLREMKLEAPVLAKIEKITGLEIISDGLGKVLDAYEKRLNEITARGIRVPQLNASLMATRNEFDLALGMAWKGLPTTSDLKGADKLLMELRQLRQESEISDEQMRNLRERLQGIDFSDVFGLRKDRALAFAEQLQTMVTAIRQMADLQKQLRGNAAGNQPKDVQETREINQQIDTLREKYNYQNWIIDGKKWELNKSQETKASIDDQTSALGETLSAVKQLAAGWSDVSSRIAQATTDMRTFALASQSMPLSAAETQMAATGGRAWDFLAGGGRPLGMDSIPAMLSPGEFVINAASSRQFASQLVAMNAGIKPVFRNEGGNVTNIGDINVTVTGGGSSRQTARSIAAELRRELRRGTSVL